MSSGRSTVSRWPKWIVPEETNDVISILIVYKSCDVDMAGVDCVAFGGQTGRGVVMMTSYDTIPNKFSALLVFSLC